MTPQVHRGLLGTCTCMALPNCATPSLRRSGEAACKAALAMGRERARSCMPVAVQYSSFTGTHYTSHSLPDTLSHPCTLVRKQHACCREIVGALTPCITR